MVDMLSMVITVLGPLSLLGLMLFVVISRK